MGGPGSGRKPGKYYLDVMPSVDLRYLNQNDYLIPGFTSMLNWSRKGVSLGYVVIKAAHDILQVRCRVRMSPVDSWHQIEQQVRLTWTSCQFGSERPWMLCPDCGRRVLVLYTAVSRFSCRHCLKLTYKSRNEGIADTQIRRVWRARNKLGAVNNMTVPIGGRPIGMHRKTFHRLRSQAERLEREVWGSMQAWLNK